MEFSHAPTGIFDNLPCRNITSLVSHCMMDGLRHSLFHNSPHETLLRWIAFLVIYSFKTQQNAIEQFLFQLSHGLPTKCLCSHRAVTKRFALSFPRHRHFPTRLCLYCFSPLREYLCRLLHVLYNLLGQR